MNNEELFDQLFKDKLENVDIIQTDNVWDKFSRASKMNAAREGHFFDQAISRSLVNISGPAVGNEWLAFKNHWDNHEQHIEHQFDNQIRSSIQSARLAPDTKAFSILESALSQSNIRNKNLIPSKIIEGVLLSIIVVLISMYTPLLTNDTKDLRKNKLEAPKLNEKSEYDRASVGRANENQQLLSLINNGSFKGNGNVEVNNTIQNNHSIKIDKKDSKLDIAQNNSYLNSTIFDKNKLYIQDINPNDLSDNGITVNHDPISGEILSVDNSFSSIERVTFNNMVDKTFEFSKAPIYSMQPISIFSNENYPNYNVIPVKLDANKKSLSSVWLGLRIGRAFDLIRSPSYNDKRILTSQRVNSSIFAFDIEVKNEFVNISTGISYSNKKFGSDPSTNKTADETANFINIPLSLKKEFFADNSIVPYFMVGPDFTIVTSAKYNPISETENTFPKGDRLPAPNRDYPGQKLADGIMNKGKLSTNSFLGIHGSLGFEAKLNNFNKVTFDVSQQINPFEKGLGINNHRFSETIVSIGFKKLLFENLY